MQTHEAVDTGIEIDEALPDRFAETANHINCPNHRVPMVMLLHSNGRQRRPMVFRGVVAKAPAPPEGCILKYPEVGDIAVSMPKQFGFETAMHFVPADQVVVMN